MSRYQKIFESNSFTALDDTTRSLLVSLQDGRLSFQQMREMVVMARDFRSWEKPNLSALLSGDTLTLPEQGRAFFGLVRERWLSYKKSGPSYEEKASTSRRSVRPTHFSDPTRNVLGPCPVASPKTLCCNLYTIDAALGCGFSCSYCSVQTFYSPGEAALDTGLHERLAALELDPNVYYHIGSGQSSDPLMWGNRAEVLKAQVDFARQNPNVFLELKTKSDHLSPLLELNPPENLFLSWSLNTDAVVTHEEHGTASLERRLDTARQAADSGIKVGFHFHPMVRYQGSFAEYQAIIAEVMRRFSTDEIAFVSLGTLTFIKSVLKTLRETPSKSKILQMPMEQQAGKWSYPYAMKREIFQAAWEAFEPWREEVFFYICMEEPRLWEDVLGWKYENNEAFESAMLAHLRAKLTTP